MSALTSLSSRIVISGLALILIACSSGVKLDEVNDASTTRQKQATPTTTAQPEREVKSVTLDPLNDPNNPLSKRSIYFAFDSYVVAAEYEQTLAAHARYLIANPQQKILIQGNTDERGTTEYNLALGQKRAEAVRQSLALLGVANSQMEAVSLGKEKPRNPGHDEAAWQENRRADILY
jgi:peptidoglycan-associated lipoprotein